MRAGDQAARRQHLWRYNPNEGLAQPQWKQTLSDCIHQPVVRQGAGLSREIKPLKWHVQPSSQRPRVILLGNVPGCDEHTIRPDIERDGPLLGGGQHARRQPPTQAIEFRSAGPRSALGKREPARFGHKGPDRSAPAPFRRPFELDAAQTAASLRLFVYKQAARRRPDTTDDPTIEL